MCDVPACHSHDRAPHKRPYWLFVSCCNMSRPFVAPRFDCVAPSPPRRRGLCGRAGLAENAPVQAHLALGSPPFAVPWRTKRTKSEGHTTDWTRSTSAVGRSCKHGFDRRICTTSCRVNVHWMSNGCRMSGRILGGRGARPPSLSGGRRGAPGWRRQPSRVTPRPQHRRTWKQIGQTGQGRRPPSLSEARRGALARTNKVGVGNQAGSHHDRSGEPGTGRADRARRTTAAQARRPTRCRAWRPNRTSGTSGHCPEVLAFSVLP